jgi:hypothetical protein
MRGADLQGAWFDDKTYLDGVNLDRAFMSGCRWRGTDVARIAWPDLRVLGEEDAAPREPRERRPAAYARAADGYGRISQLLRDQGRLSEASRFYFRSNLMRRKYLWSIFADGIASRRLWGALRVLPRLIGQGMMELVAGYGEYPARVVAWVAGVVGTFALLYVLTGSAASHPFTVPSALVFSLSSLLGRGYALVLPFGSLAEPVSILSAVEAAIGLLLEVLFVAALTRRVIGG